MDDSIKGSSPQFRPTILGNGDDSEGRDWRGMGVRIKNNEVVGQERPSTDSVVSRAGIEDVFLRDADVVDFVCVGHHGLPL